MDIWLLMQATGAVGFVASLIPQFVRTLQRRRAEDVSLAFLIILLLASLVLIPYSIHTDQWFFVFSFGGNVVVWGTVLYYRLHPQPQPAAKG